MNEPQLADSISFIISDNSNVLCFENICEECTIIELPTVHAPRNVTWKATIDEILLAVLDTSNLPTIIWRMTNICIPGGTTKSYIVNLVISIQVSTEFRENLILPEIPLTEHLKWLNIVDLYPLYTMKIVATPDLLELFPVLNESLGGPFPMHLPEGVMKVGTYIEANSAILNLKTGHASIDHMIEESHLKKYREQIYSDYLTIVYPNFLMCFGSFRIVTSYMGFNAFASENLFRSADLTSRGYLSFQEFFAICLALEPSTKHAGENGIARTTFIYRYLNISNNGRLTLKELREFVVLLRRSKNQPIDASNVNKDFDNLVETLQIASKPFISLTEFLQMNRENQLPGLANILRCTKGLVGVLPLMQVLKALNRNFGDNQDEPLSLNIRKIPDSGKYEIATHFTNVSEHPLKFHMESIFTIKTIKKKHLEEAGITPLARKQSMVNFNLGYICNDLITSTKTLAECNHIEVGNQGNDFGRYDSGTLNRSIFAQNFMTVCNTAAQIFAQEPVLLRVSSPVFIFGDLHGNFGDLLYLERMLWPLGFANYPFTVLFLGDYVDRGLYCIETMSYMFAHKVLYPNKFFMLRGNHEIRDVQYVFTFANECLSKFGPHQGKLVFETVNNCFDHLPLVAIVDNELFCCHGGIPPPWLCTNMNMIAEIEKPIPRPNDTCPLAWDILWNDPIKDEEMTVEVMLELRANNGFAKNLKRGTAHMFDQTATMEFLRINNFSHIVRAHEFMQQGFGIYHLGRVISLFTSSNYSGMGNDSSCIQVENKAINIIRFTPTEHKMRTFTKSRIDMDDLF